MKKIVLSLAVLATLASADEAILGEFGTPTKQKESGVSLDAGLWYITWDQTSTASDILKNHSDAIDTTYNIDNSLASTLNLNLNYQYLSGNVEYYNNSLSSSSGNDISGLNIGLSLLDYIPYINIEARYVKAYFKGDYKGDLYAIKSSDDGIGEATFETELNIMDIIIYPFNKYVGIGYRTYKYEVPQDLYLIYNSDGLFAGLQGSDDINYEGSFYTAVLDNKRMVDTKTDYNGLVYSASYGIGKLSPKSTINEGLNKYYADSDAQYFDLLVGYSYKSKSNAGFGYGFSGGYRYNKIDTTANKASNSDGYSLITEFNTEFYGPFVDLTISY